MTQKQPGYVYLFKNEFNYTKIGHAINPNNRAKTIESSSGLTVVESYTSPVCFNHAEIENALQRQFAEYRKKGEWFDVEFNTVKAALDSYFQEVEILDCEPIIAISNQAINDQNEPTVNARDLHAFLEVATEFSHWIKRRIEEYEFTEGEDFSSNLAKTPSDAGGRPSKEYFISLDMAKELSMVERTAKGKEARQYFIACEKSLKQGKPPMIDSDLRNVIYTVVVQALEDLSKPKRIQQPVPRTLPRTKKVSVSKTLSEPHQSYQHPRFTGWREAIDTWLKTKLVGEEFTLREVAKKALGLERHELDRPAEMTIGITLKSFGCKRLQIRRKGKRGYFYTRREVF